MDQKRLKKEFPAEDFTIATQFKKYLGLVKLDIRKMPPFQVRETRRAFFGAAGQLLIMMRDEIGALPENEAVAVVEKMLKEIADFWHTEYNRQN